MSSQEIKIGDNVRYEDKDYIVLGFSAVLDENRLPYAELAWNDYNVSPTGYLAVPRSRLTLILTSEEIEEILKKSKETILLANDPTWIEESIKRTEGQV